MARRGLLNEADRKRFFEAPDDDACMTRLYSLSDDDRDFIFTKCDARNQLGMAVQLSVLRFPGFGLRLDTEPPARLIQFLARQIGAQWEVFQDYAGTRLAANIFGRRPSISDCVRARAPIAMICSISRQTSQCRRMKAPR